MKKSIRCDVRIQDNEDAKGDIALEPNSTYTLEIDYPFDGSVYSFPIKVGKKGMGTNTLIEKICAIYKKMDDNEEDYSWFGHCLGDLVIEGISVDSRRKLITLSIGS